MTRDIFCVWVGDRYSFDYVETLRDMVLRNTQYMVRFHVITDRVVLPAEYIHHAVDNVYPITGWWNKVRLFDTEMFAGELLYFDLDIVLTNSIDWIFELDTEHVWSIRDYRHLWQDTWRGYNTSVIWCDNARHQYLWDKFNSADAVRVFRGDQDYITHVIPQTRRRFFDVDRFVSWRWQACAGGYNFNTREYNRPNTATVVTERNTGLVFHGEPNPSDCDDSVVRAHWRKNS